jgi:hypothetical protein
MKTINVAQELKKLDGTFLARDLRVNRRRPDSAFDRYVDIRVIYFLGLALIEVRTLVSLFKCFKQTRVKTVTVEARDGGLSITFDRAQYFLKGIKEP